MYQLYFLIKMYKILQMRDNSKYSLEGTQMWITVEHVFQTFRGDIDTITVQKEYIELQEDSREDLKVTKGIFIK